MTTVTTPSSGGMPVPLMQTDRLVMRGHGLADYVDCLDLWTEPAVTRYIGGRPFSSEEVWGRLQRYVGHWSLLGYGYWLVAEKGTGAFVGEVGFADFKRQITPSFDGVPEIGWALLPTAQGKG